MAQRVSQIVVASLNGMAANVRSSQLVLETAVSPTGNVRVSQSTLETCIAAKSNLRASQIALEILRLNPLLVSQIVAEILLVTPVYYQPPVFPALPGMAFPIVMRPVWRTSQALAAGSGRSKRIQLATYPTWEWDLTFEYLPDFTGNGLTASDYRDLVGLFQSISGGWNWFLWLDQLFNTVAAQPIGTGDGTTTTFTLAYTAGLGGSSILDPIGWLNIAQPLNVYIDGVAQTGFTKQLGTPHAQRITFNTPPVSGAAITVDMQFYFAVRFKDDVLDFEQFMYQLWTQKKLTLQSHFG